MRRGLPPVSRQNDRETKRGKRHERAQKLLKIQALAGGAQRSGLGGRRFKSCHFDQNTKYLADLANLHPRNCPRN
jgi:hypothetical protein